MGGSGRGRIFVSLKTTGKTCGKMRFSIFLIGAITKGRTHAVVNHLGVRRIRKSRVDLYGIAGNSSGVGGTLSRKRALVVADEWDGSGKG